MAGMKKRAWASLVPVAALVGCASTGVVQTGRDTYLIAKKSPQVGLGRLLASRARPIPRQTSSAPRKERPSKHLSWSKLILVLLEPRQCRWSFGAFRNRPKFNPRGSLSASAARCSEIIAQVQPNNP